MTIYKLTKLTMCKTIITALYNLPELVTEDNKVQWVDVKALMRNKIEDLQNRYDKAKRIINDRL